MSVIVSLHWDSTPYIRAVAMCLDDLADSIRGLVLKVWFEGEEYSSTKPTQPKKKRKILRKNFKVVFFSCLSKWV